MSFWPRKITIQDIALNSLWALISGFIASILIVFIVFVVSTVINIPAAFSSNIGISDTNPLFPFILSFITFISTMLMVFLTVKILTLIDNERYKKNTVIYGQIAFFGILMYLCVTPLYIYMGLLDYQNILTIFIVHTIFLTFGTSLLLEILTNYRYILAWFYGSFVGLFFTSIIVVFIFQNIENGYAKLLSLLILLPIINTLLIFFKGLFELLYYKYYLFSNLDQLWDIFYQIEKNEAEDMRIEEEKNTL